MITVRMNLDELDALLTVASTAISMHDKGEKIAPTYTPETVELLRKVQETLQPFYDEKIGIIEITLPPLNIK